MATEAWHYTVRVLDQSRIIVRLPATAFVLSPEEAVQLCASIQAAVGAVNEAEFPSLERIITKIREDAQKVLDPDRSTIKEELDALDWQLSEIARHLSDMEKFNDAGKEYAIAQARRCLNTSIQRSYRAKQLADGLRVLKAR